MVVCSRERHRLDRTTPRESTVAVAVVDDDVRLGPQRFVHHARGRTAFVATGSTHPGSPSDVTRSRTLFGGHRGEQLVQSRRPIRGKGSLRIGSQRDGYRGRLGRRKRQRGERLVGCELIAPAPAILGVDWDPRPQERRHVALDGARGDFEVLGEPPRRASTTPCPAQ